MTMSDLTPSFVSTLKGQALRDAWERVFGRTTQSKDSAQQRRQINEELARRAKGDEAPVAPPTAEKPSLAAQAKQAEESGDWTEAASLWTAAAGAAKNKKLAATFAGNAAAAKVRAEGQPKPAPVLDLPAAQSSGEPVVAAVEMDAIDAALADEPTQDDINSAPVDEAAAEAEGDKPVEAPAAPVTTLAAPKKAQVDHDGRRLPRAKKPSKATEAEERLTGARVMARALCTVLNLRVSVDGEGRWIEPTLEQVENMDVPDGKRADWIKLQTQLQIIESAKPARASKAAKAPKSEKVPATPAPAKKTEDELKALIAAGQPVDVTLFRHLMPVHLKYGKAAKGHTYAPTIAEDGSVKWTRTDKAPRQPKPAATPRTTNSTIPPIGTVIIKRDRHGNERCRCTVVESGIEYAGKVYGSLSGAGLQSMRDLGLTSPTCDGIVWWGLKSASDRPKRDGTAAQSRAKKAPPTLTSLWSSLPARVRAVLGEGAMDGINCATVADEFAAAAKVFRQMAKLTNGLQAAGGDPAAETTEQTAA